MPRGWQEKMRTPPAPAQQAHLWSARHQSKLRGLGAPLLQAGGDRRHCGQLRLGVRRTSFPVEIVTV